MMKIIRYQFFRHRQLIVYCIIGCSGATLDFIFYVVLTRAAEVHYQFANFLSVSVGIVNNFFLNCFFNFKTKDRICYRLASFYFVGMFGWALSACLLWLAVEIIGMNVAMSKLATIAIVTIVQFSLNKLITFKRKCDGKN